MLLLSGMANANRVYSNIAMRYVWNHNHTEIKPQYITIYKNVGYSRRGLWVLLLDQNGVVIVNRELPDDITSINRIITTDSSYSSFILAGTGGLVSIDQDNNFHVLPLLGYEMIDILKTIHAYKFEVVANRTEIDRRYSVSFKVFLDNKGVLHDMGDDQTISSDKITSATSLMTDDRDSTKFFVSSKDHIYKKSGNGSWSRFETPHEYSFFHFIPHNRLKYSSLLVAFNTNNGKWYKDDFRNSSSPNFLPVFSDQMTNVGPDYFSHAVTPDFYGNIIVSLNDSQDASPPQTIINYTNSQMTKTFSGNFPPYGASINAYETPVTTIFDGEVRTIHRRIGAGIILCLMRNKNVYRQDFDLFGDHEILPPTLLFNLPNE